MTLELLKFNINSLENFLDVYSYSEETIIECLDDEWFSETLDAELELLGGAYKSFIKSIGGLKLIKVYDKSNQLPNDRLINYNQEKLILAETGEQFILPVDAAKLTEKNYKSSLTNLINYIKQLIY